MTSFLSLITFGWAIPMIAVVRIFKGSEAADEFYEKIADSMPSVGEIIDTIYG